MVYRCVKPLMFVRRRPVLRLMARSRSFVRTHKWPGLLGAAAVQTLGDIVGSTDDNHRLVQDVVHFLAMYVAMLLTSI